MPPSPSLVPNHCFFTFCCCLLHFYCIITITRCSSISSSSISARALPTTAAIATGEALDPGGVQLERGSRRELALLAKEGPPGADRDILHGSASDLDTPPPEPLSDNHVPPPDLTEAAAAVASCPEDSAPTAGGGCECPPDGCSHFPPPPCMFRLRLVEGGGTPGHCCPRYECVGCERDEDKLLGRCQCAKGALIDPLGRTCHCLDPHKSVVNGECVCDELKCRLPAMCNRKSVAVQVQEGCCKRTVCTPCPPDSESTALDSDLLEDHCVCLPCHTNCGYNETVIIKKKGTGFPGSCCDLYECRQPEGVGASAGSPLDEERLPPPVENGGEDAKAATVDASALYCLVGDVRYPNGATWTTRDQQICHCISGLSRCSSSEKIDALENPCFVDLKWYANGENWTKEDGCTQCICRNGEQQCISHFCEVKESHIHSERDNDTASSSSSSSTMSSGDVETPCFSSDGRLYRHMDTWSENGGCALCICYTGKTHCQEESGCSAGSAAAPSSSSPSVTPSVECQPLANCNKSCANGYKINRKGCEICKCDDDSAGVDGKFLDGTDDLLTKYNISMADLIRILNEYRDRHSATSTSTASSTTITTTLSSSSSDVEDSEALSSRIWKEVIRVRGGAPKSEEEEKEEAEQRRGGRQGATPLANATMQPSPAPIVTPIDRHAAAADTTAEAEADGKGNGEAHVIVAYVVAAAGAAAAATAFVAAFCLYRSRRKSSCSVDLTRCRYEHVDGGGGGTTNGNRRPLTTTTLSAAVTPTLTLLNNNNNDDDVTIKKKTTTDHPLL